MDASHAAGNLVFSTTEVNDRGAGKFLGGEQGLAYARAQLGNGNFDTDPGGVIRRTPFELQGLKSFSVATAERATGKTIRPFSGDRKLIDFAGPAGTIPSVSYSHVFNGTFPPRVLPRQDRRRRRVGAVAAGRPPTSRRTATRCPAPRSRPTRSATVLRRLPADSSCRAGSTSS